MKLTEAQRHLVFRAFAHLLRADKSLTLEEKLQLMDIVSKFFDIDLDPEPTDEK
jgi:hypothetical protein